MRIACRSAAQQHAQGARTDLEQQCSRSSAAGALQQGQCSRGLPKVAASWCSCTPGCVSVMHSFKAAAAADALACISPSSASDLTHLHYAAIGFETHGNKLETNAAVHQGRQHDVQAACKLARDAVSSKHHITVYERESSNQSTWLQTPAVGGYYSTIGD